MMCEKIIQTVEDGKRGAQPAAQAATGDPIQIMIEQLRNAPDMENVNRLVQTVTMMIMNHPEKDAIQKQLVNNDPGADAHRTGGCRYFRSRICSGNCKVQVLPQLRRALRGRQVLPELRQQTVKFA